MTFAPPADSPKTITLTPPVSVTVDVNKQSYLLGYRDASGICIKSIAAETKSAGTLQETASWVETILVDYWLVLVIAIIVYFSFFDSNSVKRTRKKEEAYREKTLTLLNEISQKLDKK